jgi:hypothetical protein
MALTRRDFLWTVPLCVSALSACAKTPLEAAVEAGPRELLTSRSAGSSAPTILVLMPETAQTKEVWGGLIDELAEDYQLVAVRVEASSDSAVIDAALRRYSPVGLVLMNNPTVNAYRRLQRASPAAKFPPAVIVMTSFLETQTGELRGATGISYEVPLITAMTNLRRLLVLPSERVGVVSRAPLRGFIERQIDLSAREKVVVIQEQVSQSPNPSELKRAIRSLKGTVDVLWILNDDKLLTPKLITEGWLPGLDERPWVPTIVGAASLVSSGSNFGTFAVLPDHAALGAQAASMLLDISEDDWQVEDGARIQLPLSTTTTIDLLQTRERFRIQPNALKQVDRILE